MPDPAESLASELAAELATESATELASAPAGSSATEVVCAAADLDDGGLAFVFDVLEFGRPARAFVLRFGGRVVAYLNRCLHVPTELDWQPGHFLDGDRRFIICSIHGATYEPADGRCVGGPCGRGRLTALQVEERGDGQVVWYPSHDVQPLRFDDPAAPANSP